MQDQPSSRAFDANADAGAAGSSQFGALPDWDLNDLYSGEDAPELGADMKWLEGECAAFASTYEGKLADLDAAGMLECVLRNEKISSVAGRIMSFAGLRHYQNMVDADRAKFMSDCQDRITAFTTPLVFFTLEINRIDDDKIDALFEADTGLARYWPVFERMRAMRPHQLSDELEKYLHDQSVVGATAWNKLFDETIAGLTFEVEGATLSLEATLNFLTEPEREKREEAARELARVFGDNVKLFARVHNTLAKEKEVEDRWRKLADPQASRHLANHVEPEVVQALRDAVVAAYPRLSHRYYQLKRKWLGLDKMQVWDRNAPLPMEDTSTVNWQTARETVMGAYAGFSPDMAKIAEPFFERGWIDAGVKPGKAPGAFAHPTVVDVHPYVMLNYLGKPRDVMTLAHELGNGVHQVLAAGQGE
ncbi:MAG: M3 family oligoendopeptidase, partial [Paracoccaceae bacterium]